MIRKRKLHSIKTVYNGKSGRTVHVTEKWGSRQKLGTQSQELAEVQIEDEKPETNLIANCATNSSSVSDVDTSVTFDELYRCCDCCSWETTCLTCLPLRHKHLHLHLEEHGLPFFH
ncbi:hypothetical protein DPMN_184002 [Dreissena polymorpha]|uniref:Uncharacterized protein n=1 Tax=Dreissena polymorpha TaxID=45954 RepID=A0A9D4DHN8_DREPO|nr:hypothetical protein DPMN_184002 [Dreissena polymorpha]